MKKHISLILLILYSIFCIMWSFYKFPIEIVLSFSMFSMFYPIIIVIVWMFQKRDHSHINNSIRIPRIYTFLVFCMVFFVFNIAWFWIYYDAIDDILIAAFLFSLYFLLGFYVKYGHREIISIWQKSFVISFSCIFSFFIFFKGEDYVINFPELLFLFVFLLLLSFFLTEKNHQDLTNLWQKSL